MIGNIFSALYLGMMAVMVITMLIDSLLSFI